MGRLNFIWLLLILTGCQVDVEEMLMPNDQAFPQELGSEDNSVFLELKNGALCEIEGQLEQEFLKFLRFAKKTTLDGNVGSRVRLYVGSAENPKLGCYDLELDRAIIWGDGRQYAMLEATDLHSKLIDFARKHLQREH